MRDFKGWMPILSFDQQYQNTEGNPLNYNNSKVFLLLFAITKEQQEFLFIFKQKFHVGLGLVREYKYLRRNDR